MLALCLAHLGLAIRSTIVCTAKIPEAASTPCTDTNCNVVGCRGNRLEVVAPGDAPAMDGPSNSAAPQPEPSTSAAFEPAFFMSVPHHKTQGSGCSLPPMYICSPKLTSLLQFWLSTGRPKVIASNRGAAPSDALFLTAKACAFNSLTDWYSKLHARKRAPYPYLSLQKHRTVFISDRIEAPDRPGPSNEGAAILMGNSVRQWFMSYAPNLRHHQARQASEDMAAYRASLLAEERTEAMRRQGVELQDVIYLD